MVLNLCLAMQAPIEHQRGFAIYIYGYALRNRGSGGARRCARAVVAWHETMIDFRKR
jgi:hypothetical protein